MKIVQQKCVCILFVRLVLSFGEYTALQDWKTYVFFLLRKIDREKSIS